MKLIKAFTFGLSIFLVQPAAAQNADPMQVSAFLDIIADNGCSMTEDEAEIIFPLNGYDKSLTRQIAADLIDQGVVAFESGSLTIIDGSCEESEGLNDTQQIFVDILALNGCQMTEDGARIIFPANGMDTDLAFEIAEGLIEAGIATLSDDRQVISVGPEYCSPPATGIDTETALLADPDVQQFISILAFNGCGMAQSEIGVIYPQAGMDLEYASEIRDRLLDAGTASFTQIDGFTIPEPICMPAEDIINTDAPSDPESSVLDDMNLMLEIMGTVGCRLDSSSSDAVFTAGGLDPEIGVARAFELISQGFAEIVDGTVLVIAEPPCVSTVSGESEAPEITEPLAIDTATDGYESPEDIFHSVMASSGCELTELNARNVFPAAGLPMEDAYSIADQLVSAGQAYYSEDDTTLTVTSAACTDRMQAANPVEAAETDPVEMVETMPATDDPEAQFLALLAANACEITQTNARDIIAAAGMDYNTTMGIAAAMLNDGRASSPDGGQTLQVSAPLCVTAGAGNAGPMTPRDIFIEVLRGNNCTMTAGEFSSLLPVDGLDQNVAFGLITELEAEGVISLPPTRDVVTLTVGNCR